MMATSKRQGTALLDDHRTLGAKMTPFAGFEMPLMYSSIKSEVLAVRKAAGIFDVSHMGEIFVEGADAESFVDFLLCNDFFNAGNQKAVYSPLCNSDGGMLDDLIAYKLEQGRVLLCVNAANIAKDENWIRSHAAKFKVDISNRSADYSLLALQGPRAAKTLHQLNAGLKNNFPTYSAKSIMHEGRELIVARTGYTGEDGFEIFGPHSLIKKLWPQMMEAGVTPCGLASRDVLRIEAAYPLYGQELGEEWTPLDAGLRWTVKLKGGDFIGKSALASHRPHLRLIKLALDRGIPRTGHAVRDSHGAALGRITSGTLSPTVGRGIGLALLERAKLESAPAEGEFQVVIRDRPYRAKYCPRAFIREFS